MSVGTLPQTSQSYTSPSNRVGLLKPGGNIGCPLKSTAMTSLLKHFLERHQPFPWHSRRTYAAGRLHVTRTRGTGHGCRAQLLPVELVEDVRARERQLPFTRRW